jgi:isopenicillin-N epimerase
MRTEEKITIDHREMIKTPQGERPLDDTARRRFLQMIGAGAAVAATGIPVNALANVTSPGGGRTLADAIGVGPPSPLRNEFILDRQFVFMNIGTAGSVPRKVVKALNEANIEQARTSGNGYGNYATQRAQIAPGFGVDPDELALSYNTTDGMCSALLGIPWQANDCVVTTNHEHPGGNVPLQIAADRYGVAIRRVQLPVGNDQTAQDYVDLFRDKIHEAMAEGLNVRALMWSSPTFLTGTMLPIRRLVDLAIEYGLITICDGAHLPGMMNYNYAELGVDFMSGAGHKWQCAPGATGILVVRNKVRSEYNPLPLPEYYPVTTSSYSTNMSRIDGVPGTVPWTERAIGSVATYDIAAVLSSIGSRDAPGLNALADSCAMWDEIGRDTIEDYVIGLSMHLKESIAERWGVQALGSPKDDPELVSALTSFNPFLDDSSIFSSSASGAFVTRLREYGFIVRNTNVPVVGSPNIFPLRVSTHLWHSKREVDQFVDAAWQIANSV